MKQYIAILVYTVILGGSAFAQSYAPFHYENKFKLHDVQVLSLDQNNENDMNLKATKWEDFFSGATMYETNLLLRIIPAGKTEKPRLNYIDIKRDGTGFGSNSSFEISGPHLYLNKVKLYRSKKTEVKPVKVEMEAELNSPLSSKNRNAKVRIVLTASPTTTATVTLP